MAEMVMQLNEPLSTLLNFLFQNPLTVFNTLLLIFTAYLGYTSFKFQNRTSIRESLEQLDDVALGTADKIRPILHSFKFRIFGESKATVLLRHYAYPNNPAVASITTNPLFHSTIYKVTKDEEVDLTREVIEDALVKKVSELRGVDDAWIGEKGIFVVFHSRNAVEVRTRTETAVDTVADVFKTTNAERLAENLDIETEK